MEIRYFKYYSSNLNRDMEYKVYGSSGKCLIYFPTQYNRFYEVEDKGVIHALSGFIENGQVMVVAIDNIDGESLSNFGYWDKRKRLERQESYFNYFYHEFLPRIEYELNYDGRPYLVGMSFGAYQAMTCFLRVPFMFDGIFSFSGIYNIRYFFNDYFDDLALLNSPIDLAYTLNDGDMISIINSKKLLAVVSYGAYEDQCINDTRELEYILQTKGIFKEFYYWSSDFPHDFPSWNHYLAYYLPSIL